MVLQFKNRYDTPGHPASPGLVLLKIQTVIMKKFIIERKLPGAGNMTPEELKELSKASNAVISVLGKPYVWIQSFVTEDKIYCIHEAENEEVIREHGRCGNIPVNTIEEIMTVIDPTTAG
jgi:Protein of unknown function (DUF4242)